MDVQHTGLGPLRTICSKRRSVANGYESCVELQSVELGLGSDGLFLERGDLRDIVLELLIQFGVVRRSIDDIF